MPQNISIPRSLPQKLEALYQLRRTTRQRTLDGVKAALATLPFPAWHSPIESKVDTTGNIELKTADNIKGKTTESNKSESNALGANNIKGKTAENNKSDSSLAAHKVPLIIQIVGTNGKGSTAAMLTQCCRAAGLRTGRFTSPHLHHFRERFSIDDSAPTDERLEHWLDRLEALIEPFQLAFFDVATLLAVCLFAEADVDVAIMEAGIGGRLDATSALPTALTILTTVGHDHQAILGQTLEEITADKAAAFRHWAISGITQPRLQAQLEAIAARQGLSRLWQWPRDMSYQKEDAGTLAIALHPQGPGESHVSIGFDALQLSLQGDFQHHNAMLAVAAFAMLAPRWGLAVEAWPQALRQGLATTRWPGRLHRWQWKGLTILIDGAHNPEAIEALCRNRPAAPYQLVFGASQDKEIARCLAPLLAQCRGVHFCPFDQPRAADQRQLLAALSQCDPTQQAHLCPSDIHFAPQVDAAINAAINAAQPNEFVLVTGSLFVAAEAIAYLHHQKDATPM